MRHYEKVPIFITICLAGAGLGSTFANADTLEVISSGGFYSSMEKLIPIFEKQTGHTVHLSSGSSMGESPTAIQIASIVVNVLTLLCWLLLN